MGATAKWIDCHVGERIRLRRALVGMTQEDLARAQSIEARAITDQIRSLVTFRRVTGQTLIHHRVRLENIGKGR